MILEINKFDSVSMNDKDITEYVKGATLGADARPLSTRLPYPMININLSVELSDGGEIQSVVLRDNTNGNRWKLVNGGWVEKWPQPERGTKSPQGRARYLRRYKNHG